MVSLEARILKQRQEQVQRTFLKFPDKAREYFNKYCLSCTFLVKGKTVDQDDQTITNVACIHQLCPCTSIGLPCPYYRT